MIEIRNLTSKEVDENFIKKVAEIVLIGENKKESYLSIALVGRVRMRRLNREYRKKNRVTDVLAFPGEKKLKEGLGEVVICLREVKKNAKRYQVPFKKELAQVLIHGVLHLLGYDHEKSPKRAEEMSKKIEEYLSKINF